MINDKKRADISSYIDLLLLTPANIKIVRGKLDADRSLTAGLRR